MSKPIPQQKPAREYTPIQLAYARMNDLFQCGTRKQFKEAEREFWQLVKDSGIVKGDWGQRR